MLVFPQREPLTVPRLNGIYIQMVDKSKQNVRNDKLRYAACIPFHALDIVLEVSPLMSLYRKKREQFRSELRAWTERDATRKEQCINLVA